ncbi:MAG: cupin domain-containing protein [Methanothrix sp.]|nr:MAG: cupin domain-containing protein [Methanothrix sp.]
MKKMVLLMVLALCCTLAVAFAATDGTNQTVSGASAGSAEKFGTEFTLVNIDQFEKENPINPAIGILTANAALGKNASINVTQIEPGKSFGAHYHQYRDEIDYIVKGQANMTIAGNTHLVKAGDLIYVPPMTVHDFTGIGSENMALICVFTPPYDGKDRIYV